MSAGSPHCTIETDPLIRFDWCEVMDSNIVGSSHVEVDGASIAIAQSTTGTTAANQIRPSANATDRNSLEPETLGRQEHVNEMKDESVRVQFHPMVHVEAPTESSSDEVNEARSPKGDQLWTDVHEIKHQGHIMFAIELIKMAAIMRPFFGWFWDWPNRATAFLRARGLHRKSFRELWQQRKQRETNMVVALEYSFMFALISVLISLFILLWSILQLLSNKVPASFTDKSHCDFFGAGSVPFLNTSTALYGLGQRFASEFIETDPLSGIGYHTNDGRFGQCIVSQQIITTLSVAPVVEAMAWIISYLSILAFAYAFLLYLTSGTLLVLLHQVERKLELPHFDLIQRYYRTNKHVIGFGYFSMVVMAGILTYFIFTPTLLFWASECPVRSGLSSRNGVVCWYTLQDRETQWGSLLTCLLVILSGLQLVHSISNVLDLLRDPFQALPAQAIFYAGAYSYLHGPNKSPAPTPHPPSHNGAAAPTSPVSPSLTSGPDDKPHDHAAHGLADGQVTHSDVDIPTPSTVRNRHVGLLDDTVYHLAELYLQAVHYNDSEKAKMKQIKRGILESLNPCHSECCRKKSSTEPLEVHPVESSTVDEGLANTILPDWARELSANEHPPRHISTQLRNGCCCRYKTKKNPWFWPSSMVNAMERWSAIMNLFFSRFIMVLTIGAVPIGMLWAFAVTAAFYWATPSSS